MKPRLMTESRTRLETDALSIEAGNVSQTFDLEIPGNTLIRAVVFDFWDPATGSPRHVRVPLRGQGGSSFDDGDIKLNATGTAYEHFRHIQVDVENIDGRAWSAILSVDYVQL